MTIYTNLFTPPAIQGAAFSAAATGRPDGNLDSNGTMIPAAPLSKTPMLQAIRRRLRMRPCRAGKTGST